MEKKSFHSTNDIIASLALLGRSLSTRGDLDLEIFRKAFYKNNWFTEENIELAITNIVGEFLNEQKLQSFASHYNLHEIRIEPKNIGLVMAGNIPLVGFHDWICVMLAGHNAVVKLSSKDDVLFPFILEKLKSIDSALAGKTALVEQLKNFDAVIATGSNNSAKYFEHYFSKYPHIIRKNRGSVAIIDEHTTPEQLQALAVDIFSFFGLGCRNISKLFIKRGVDVQNVLNQFESFQNVKEHFKYKNNFDYRLTIVLMNNQPYYANDFVVAIENEQISSPLSVLHFEYFDSESDLKEKLEEQKENIQVIEGQGHKAFGSAQAPTLFDYADNVDVVRFLISV